MIHTHSPNQAGWRCEVRRTGWVGNSWYACAAGGVRGCWGEGLVEVNHESSHFDRSLMPALRFLGRRSAVLAGAAVFCSVNLRAQPVERSVALGVVLPAGDYAQFRTIGPAVRAGVAFGDPEARRIRLRVEFEAAWLLSRGPKPGFAKSDPGELTATSLLVSAVVGRRPIEGFAPYFIAGVALQSLTIPGRRNPYGSTLGLRVGAGIQRRVAARQYFVEIAPHLALTDFGTAGDFGTAAYVPLVVGLRF